MTTLPHGIERHRFDVGLEDLQTFLAVAELGSFSQAAKHLNLSQPSISNRVRRLEEEGQGAAKTARRDEPLIAHPRERDPDRDYWRGVAARDQGTAAERIADRPRAKAGARQETPAQEWLIPPRVSPDGKDSLGRGLDAGSIAAAVATNGSVQREREARRSYLQGAYRDPYVARAALDELVKREGWTSAAARLARKPEQLDELRGKVGWFASVAAKQERAGAERATSALPRSLERIGEAEGRAERIYRTSVSGQRAADATGIPRLSAAAEAAVGAVRASRDERARGEVWQAVQKDGRVAGELGAFRAAVAQRFGDEGVHQMLRADGQPGAISVASVAPQQRKELDQVAKLTAPLRHGERAGVSLAQSQFDLQLHIPGAAGTNFFLKWIWGEMVVLCCSRSVYASAH